MDSITQLTLGAAVCYACAGKTHGKKTLAYGAVLGTLPDLDVLLPLLDDSFNSIKNHRGFSHSIVIQLLITPFIAWLLTYIHNAKQFSKSHFLQWSLAIALALITHSLLDLFTIYGTQILLPFTDYNYAIGNLFIIDPMVTLPLLFVCILALAKHGQQALTATYKALLFVCIYISISLVLLLQANEKARTVLAANQIFYDKYTVQTLGPSILLWRVVAIDENNRYEFSFSAINSKKISTIETFTRNSNLQNIAMQHPQWQDLLWFNKDFYQLDMVDDKLLLTDVRFGELENLIFVWHLATLDSNNSWQWHTPTKTLRQTNNLSDFWQTYLQRIF